MGERKRVPDLEQPLAQNTRSGLAVDAVGGTKGFVLFLFHNFRLPSCAQFFRPMDTAAQPTPVQAQARHQDMDRIIECLAKCCHSFCSGSLCFAVFFAVAGGDTD